MVGILLPFLQNTEMVFILCYIQWCTATFQLIEIYVKLPYVNIHEQCPRRSYLNPQSQHTLLICHYLTFTANINVLLLQGKQ